MKQPLRQIPCSFLELAASFRMGSLTDEMAPTELLMPGDVTLLGHVVSVFFLPFGYYDQTLLMSHVLVCASFCHRPAAVYEIPPHMNPTVHHGGTTNP